jgi:hypothetical protein
VYRAQQEERRPPPFRRSFLRVDSPNCRYIHIKNRIKWKEQSSGAQQEERRPPPVQRIGRNEEQQYEFQERSSFFSFTFAFPSLSSMTTGEEEVTSPSFCHEQKRTQHEASLLGPSISLAFHTHTSPLQTEENKCKESTTGGEETVSATPSRFSFPFCFDRLS